MEECLPNTEDVVPGRSLRIQVRKDVVQDVLYIDQRGVCGGGVHLQDQGQVNGKWKETKAIALTGSP